MTASTRDASDGPSEDQDSPRARTFPKPGILFYDITTLLNDAQGFRDMIDALAAPYRDKGIEQVVGIESRGFILGAAVANQLGAGFVPIRKPGKLPSKTHREDYALEYGTDGLEIHEDAVRPRAAGAARRRRAGHRRHGARRRPGWCAESAASWWPVVSDRARIS